MFDFSLVSFCDVFINRVKIVNQRKSIVSQSVDQSFADVTDEMSPRLFIVVRHFDVHLMRGEIIETLAEVLEIEQRDRYRERRVRLC